MITTKKRSEILEALLLALYEGKSVTVCTDEPGFGIRHIDDCDPIHEVAFLAEGLELEEEDEPLPHWGDQLPEGAEVYSLLRHGDDGEVYVYQIAID
jgi:hypothetical protein